MLAFVVIFLSFTLGASVSLCIIVMGSSPRYRNSVIGRIYEMAIYVPIICGGACFSLFYFCDQRKGREAYEQWWDSTSKYREWTFVILYAALVWPIEYVYLLHALPELSASTWSKALSWALVLSSEVFYALAVFTNPGRVTPGWELEKQREYVFRSKKKSFPAQKRTNGSARKQKKDQTTYTNLLIKLCDSIKKHFCWKWRCSAFREEEEHVLNNHYAIDGIIYPASGCYSPNAHATPKKVECDDHETLMPIGMTCLTCFIPRPSRSKHCRYCNVCVRRFDHHCPWINNDVAEGTHRYFMTFLFLHTVSCLWASSDLFRCIKQFLLKNNAWGWKLRLSNDQTITLGYIDYARVLIFLQPRNVFLIFFAGIMSIFLYCFFIYNLRFVIRNVTINDLNKMEDLADFLSEMPTLDLVYQEAMKYCERLEKVAFRRPKALYRLPKPPFANEPGYEEGGKKNKKYRDYVRRALLIDLRGLFDRGVWNNLKEVFFPYQVLDETRISAVKQATTSS
ncbi:unnamed protein product [Phytomonas sp. EM1]|nr:unnamed protein product [Phytomonas sp. EM1]|eukprot:CCW62185.1 unnamed protein product [Phytomonas sp. isolate EM1]